MTKDPKTAAALRKIAEGIYELADAAFEATASIPAAPSGTPVYVDNTTMRTSTSSRLLTPPAANTVYEDLPFTEEAVDSDTLGRCPRHNLAWTVRPAGTSKAGKAYAAFWRCAGRDGDEFCDKRPVKTWADKHPASLVTP